MQENHLVSIVIPCHNTECLLGLAIESALGQSYGRVEVIVVDDDSTDDSVGIAAGYGAQVRLIRGNWRNGNGARNAGLKIARGEWAQFLDADDFLKPDKIAGQLATVGEDVELIYSPLIVRKEAPSGNPVEKLILPTAGADLIEQWLRWEFCQTGAALWRTESLRRIGGWKEGLPCCQDNEMVLRALQNGLKTKYVDHPGAVYRIWSEETVCRKDPRKVIRQKTELIDGFLDWLAKTGQLSQRHRLLAGQACFEMARTWVKYELKEGVRYFNERRSKGMIKLVGPAAPRSFRMIERWAGFELAERLAALRR